MASNYEVVAGDRRLTALKLLAKKKRIPADYEVPCLLVADASARTVSLAENVQRENMHPADQFAAFAALVKEGRPIEDIAADFGVSPLVVQRRLKLANVSPRLMADYRAGGVTLEQLMALTITDDHAAQEAAFYGAPEWQRSPSKLRERLTEREIDATHALVRFVGLDTYRQAGGGIRRDLFAEGDAGTYLTDTACWKRWCATSWQRWPRTCAPRVGHGWRPCRIWPTRNGRRSRTPRASAASRPPARPAASPRCKPASKRSTPNWKKPATPRTRTRPRSWNSGAIRWSGNCKTRRMPCRATPPRCARWPVPSSPSTATARPSFIAACCAKPRPRRCARWKAAARFRQRRRRSRQRRGEDADDAPKAASLSDRLAQRLSAHRTAALQIEVARHPQVALAALVHGMVQTVLQPDAYGDGLPLGVRLTVQDRLEGMAPDWPESPAAVALRELQQVAGEALPEDSAELFAALLAKSQDELVRLLAVCVASTVDVVTPRATPHQPGAELAQAVGLDMAAWWKPTAEGYFKHVSEGRDSGSRGRVCTGITSPGWRS
jgi:ParB family chromosome partitioning protein